MATLQTLSVILPAFNEAENIEAMVADVLRLLTVEDRAGEVLVVDDGSDDGTWEVVCALESRDGRVRPLRHEVNRGYGAALRTGFRAAQGDLVFFTDADRQFDVLELQTLLALTDRFDIVAGFRAPRRDPANRRLNAWAWGQLVNGLFGLSIQDVNCAFKLFDRRVIEDLEIRSDGAFVNTEILVRARAAGHSLAQVPVTHLPRVAGVQTGARPAVVARAFVELVRLYGELQPLSRRRWRGPGRPSLRGLRRAS